MKLPYCSKCGTELRSNAKFCHKCGKEATDGYQPRKEIVKFEAEECWKKDLEAMGLAMSSRNPCIALDAKRIVFSTEEKLHIFSFDGVKEQSITCEGKTGIRAVTSDCSRIFVWDFPKKIRAYTPGGHKELEIETPEASGYVAALRTSLDGKLFAAMSEKYIYVWDWNGNPIIIFKAPSQYLPFVGRTHAKFEYLDIAPNGSYIAFKYSGGPDAFVVHKIPNIGMLSKVSADERNKIWDRNVVKGLYNYIGSYSLANNRSVRYNFGFFRSCKIEIFEIIGLEIRKSLSDYELVGKHDQIVTAQMTPDGKYFLYTSDNPSLNEINFNIFDVENRIVIEKLLTFPKTVRVSWLQKHNTSFCPSHDSSKLVAIVGKEVIMYNIGQQCT